MPTNFSNLIQYFKIFQLIYLYLARVNNLVYSQKDGNRGVSSVRKNSNNALMQSMNQHDS